MSHAPIRRSPSAVAERLLGAVIRNPEWREAVVGDLREEYDTLAATKGAAAARRWHWRETLRVSGRYLQARVTGRTPAMRRRPDYLSPPDETGSPLSGLGRDARYAVRALVRRPALSAVIVLALALGLAANATIFATADALVLRPFRFANVDRLVSLASVSEHVFFDTQSIAPGDFVDWQAQLTTIDRVAAIQWWDPNLIGRDEPEQLPGVLVSPRYFETLGIAPVHGRWFQDEEGLEGAGRVAVLSHRLWTRRFDADPAIVGQTVLLDREPYEVVGIAPPGFRVPMSAEVWAPLVFDEAARRDRTRGYLWAIGRLAPGATIEDARAELATIVARQRADYPETNANRQITVKTFVEGMGDPAAPAFVAVWQAAALLLLLIACANVVNLLLARGAERQQEFAVRLALGAGRGRLFRQLFLEGLALAGAAVALALPLAWLGVELSRLALPPAVVRFVPGWEFLGLPPRVFAVTAGLAAAATVLFTLAPALQAARQTVGDTLRQGSRTLTAGRARMRGRALLASAQIGLTLALLTASAVAIGGAHRLTRGDLGFDPNEVLLARFLLPDNPYDDGDRRRQFARALLERLEGVPAIRSAAIGSSIPYGGGTPTRPFHVEGRVRPPAEVPRVDYHRATPAYFEVLRVPVVAGRGFLASDTADAPPVAVVSRSLADSYWPGEDPIGKRFRTAEDGELITVVGVVGEVLFDWFLAARNPTVYRPLEQEPSAGINLAVRTAGDPLALAGAVRRAIGAVDPDQPVPLLAPLQQVVDDKAAGLHYAATTLSVIGGVALVLALVGIYSLMSYQVGRRTQEIGVRIAFGATAADIVRLTVGQASRITVAGLVAGAALGLALGRAMQAFMFGTVAYDPTAAFTLGVVLGLAAVAASFVPARRAAALDPMVALRTE